MANRHLSRSIALQTLFEWDFNGQKDINIKEMLERNIKEFAPGIEDFSFIENLIETAVKKIKIIDEIITKVAPEWPIDKISAVDRNILRLGLSELIFGDRAEVPPKVAINEAIELAKTFGGENSGKFINGVLGAVYKEMGEPGKDQVSRRKKLKFETDPSKMPLEKLGGAVIYSTHEGETYLALVHDIFGYWTLSKGHIEDGMDESEGTIAEIKKELGIDIKIKDTLGENEYIATHPEKGKRRKHVYYFLAEASYQNLKLDKTGGGLDDAKWFKFSEIPELRIYDDILPIIIKAINIIAK